LFQQHTSAACSIVDAILIADCAKLFSFANSPIIKWCDHVILTSAHTAVLSEISMLSRLCEHAVVDLLFHLLFQNKSESGQESFYLSEIDQSEYSF
jgi:DNA-binding MurR/RpiR family transcriptional regulator